MLPKFTDKFDAQTAFGDSFELYLDTFANEGWNTPTQSWISFEDMMATSNSAEWMPRVFEEIVRDPVEPLLAITPLFDRIAYTPAARITTGALGAIVAAEIGEAEAYPERTLNIAPGTITINVGKHGVAWKITEELLKYSQFNVMQRMALAGRQALDRHKEKIGMNYVSGMGVTLFDNKTPAQSMFGTCTGRTMTGSGNGSCRMEDLVKAYAHLLMQGYVPNTLLLHPLTWAMWMADPLLQTIVKNTGNGQWFQRVSPPQSSRPWQNAGQSKMGKTSGRQHTAGENPAGTAATKTSEIDQGLTSRPEVPGYFPWALNVIVSPFMPYNPENNTCDIFLFDSENLGAIVVDEDVMMDEWEDKSVDVVKVKMRERYAHAIYEDGLGIGVLRNIPVKANEIALPVSATISAAGSLDDLDTTTAISGL
jgi:hypothetical protein